MKRSKKTSKVSSIRKKSIPRLKSILWDLCRDIIRSRDGNICVICGRGQLEGSNWHTGHFIPSSVCGITLRFDLRNLHSSCYNCNINLGGNGAYFYRSLVEKYGQDFVDNIFRDKNKICKADTIFYEKKIEEYDKIQTWDKDELLNYTKGCS